MYNGTTIIQTHATDKGFCTAVYKSGAFIGNAMLGRFGAGSQALMELSVW
jgi:hypothetical protein